MSGCRLQSLLINASPSPTAGGGCDSLIRAITRNLRNLPFLLLRLPCVCPPNLFVCVRVSFPCQGEAEWKCQGSGCRQGRQGAGSPARAAFDSEKSEICLFQARLTPSAQAPPAQADLQGWRQAGFVQTPSSVSAYARILAVPLAVGAPAIIPLALLPKPSRTNISSALGAVQLGGEAAGVQTAEEDGDSRICCRAVMSTSGAVSTKQNIIHKGSDAAVWRQGSEQRRDSGFASQKVAKALAFRVTSVDHGYLTGLKTRAEWWLRRAAALADAEGIGGAW